MALAAGAWPYFGDASAAACDECVLDVKKFPTAAAPPGASATTPPTRTSTGEPRGERSSAEDVRGVGRRGAPSPAADVPVTCGVAETAAGNRRPLDGSDRQDGPRDHVVAQQQPRVRLERVPSAREREACRAEERVDVRRRTRREGARTPPSETRTRRTGRKIARLRIGRLPALACETAPGERQDAAGDSCRRDTRRRGTNRTVESARALSFGQHELLEVVRGVRGERGARAELRAELPCDDARRDCLGAVELA